jgi:hypothetical protein
MAEDAKAPGSQPNISWTAISVIIAALAATASTAQSFFAWQNRNVPVMAAAYAQGVSFCGQAVSAADQYSYGVEGFTVMGAASQQSREYSAGLDKMRSAVESLIIFAGPFDAELETALEEVEKRLDADSATWGQVKGPGQLTLDDALKLKQSSELIRAGIRSACRGFVSKSLFRQL